MDTAATHLWGILNDKRISKDNWGRNCIIQFTSFPENAESSMDD